MRNPTPATSIRNDAFRIPHNPAPSTLRTQQCVRIKARAALEGGGLVATYAELVPWIWVYAAPYGAHPRGQLWVIAGGWS